MIRTLIVVMLLFAVCANAMESSVTSLLESAKKYLEQSQYLLVLSDLEAAQKSHPTTTQQASIQGLLGLTRYQMRQYPEAEKNLREAIQSKMGENADQIRRRLALGQIQADRGTAKEEQKLSIEAQKLFQEAQKLFQEAQGLAGQNLELELASQLSLAALKPVSDRMAALQTIQQQLPTLNNPIAQAQLTLNLAQQAKKLGTPALQLTFEALESARKLAGNDQPRLQAESLDGLAQLYEDQKRFDEAEQLNRKALDLAWRIEAHDLLINLEWRQARLYRQQQKIDDAITAFQKAIEQIETIRQDIPVEYHDGHSSFRKTLEPVYQGLADLLLSKAKLASGEQKNQLLHNARDAIELIKRSELEDFLGGRCAVQVRNTQLDQIETTTAVLYPVILPDRLELVVSSGTSIRQFSQDLDSKIVEEVIKRYAATLREKEYGQTDEARAAAKKLYDWLIAPADDWLQSRGVKTLVFVPDGVMRMLPPSALYDGEHYLIEKYALVTSPGLSLFDPQPLQQHAVKALLAGVSEPGDVVDRLPTDIWAAMLKRRELKLARYNNRGIPLTQGLERSGASQSQNSHPVERNPSNRQIVQEELKLPGVEEELSQIESIVPNISILNKDFSKENFKQQLLKQPYSVVHIASHGIFGPSAESSFILAYDDIIDMNELETLIKGEKFAKAPVELLTLSACQTAEGDDRAPLGISGMAIKARVRSALGSLWPIDDEAAVMLMASFYQNLRESGTNKAQALRQAQLNFIKGDDFSDPYYWSPFILVGNWL